MMKRTALSLFVSTVCGLPFATAEQTASELTPVYVTETVENRLRMQINQKNINQRQPQDLKSLFANSLDVSVNDLANSRSGNESINIRGLQGNRVASSIDGVPLSETQENRVFSSLGLDFGGANGVEPTSLRSATVVYSGSPQSLSGSVEFATLEPQDLIKSGNVGGFVSTGYNSVDRSMYGTLAGAAKNGGYEGLVLSTVRVGHETKNKGENGSNSVERTQANPADYKNGYVLVKNDYQVNDQHKLKLTFEHHKKTKETELASSNGAAIDRATGSQVSGFTEDQTRRTRISLGHEYQNDHSWINVAQTQVYFQNTVNENFRSRSSARAKRTESGEFKQKNYGLVANLTSYIDTAIPNVLRYGLAYHRQNVEGMLLCNSYSRGLIFSPVANTKQDKISLYIEDEMALGNVVITPHLGVLYYHSKPSTKDYRQAAEQYAAVEGQNKEIFLPKLSLNWKMNPAFEPYFQYSRGVRTPSAQQLTSSFGNAVVVQGRVVRQYAMVGNPNLRPEIADNLNLGIKGKITAVQYDVSGYYNRYKDFIDFESRNTATYAPLIQYQNLDKAKIYGLTANAKWNVIDYFYLNGGVAYAKGKAKKEGETSPINTIQPLKLKAGIGYEGEHFGSNIQLTHIKAKSDKDIKGTIYNPTRTVNLVDFGVYWKPIKSLTLVANVNNLFDKKYWNWADISYFAVQNASGTSGPTASGLSATTADTYTAPGRNFNVGVRYEF